MSAPRKFRRISRGRPLTEEEAAKYRKIRALIEEEKPEINARMRKQLAQLRALNQVFAELKGTREEKKLSLADMQQLTGIDRSTLSKLENGQRTNYTLDTVLRYADALGKQVLVTLADK